MKLMTYIILACAPAVSGCVPTENMTLYASRDAGFATVRAKAAEASGKNTVWIQSREEADLLSENVHAMVHRKSISAGTAVQVALLNNKGLQAAYADMGMSAAEAWQQTFLPNPKVSIGILGLAAPELGAFRTIEGMIANNILMLATISRRVDVADTQFRRAQLEAVGESLQLATKTRRAWINAVAAFETVAWLNQAQEAADAASELAEKLGESGALPKAGQAREHAFYAELTGQRAKARLAAQLAKEELTKLMGLWGEDTEYFVPDALPPLPKSLPATTGIEAEALRRRIDLQIARLDLEATAKNLGLTEATRYLTDLEILGGFETERETDGADTDTVTSGQIELEFAIPIFDSGKARMRKTELAYMKQANLLAEKAVNSRSEARAAHMAYRSNWQIARHYRDAVLPLRTTIADESLLTYNGMITNTFELLADTRAKISSVLLATDAKRDFWLAEADLSAAIHGGGAFEFSGKTGSATAIADTGAAH